MARIVDSIKHGPQRPRTSQLDFGHSLARTLPLLRIDPADAATDLLALSAITDAAQRIDALNLLRGKRPMSIEAMLRLSG